MLHATAIYLLRAARADDPETGLSPARLSALSVIVFAGPLSLSELAAREQVTRPAMSQLVTGLEGAGFVQRRIDPEDGRRNMLEATVEGQRVLDAARRRRIRRIKSMLDDMPDRDRHSLARGLHALAACLDESGGHPAP